MDGRLNKFGIRTIAGVAAIIAAVCLALAAVPHFTGKVVVLNDTEYERYFAAGDTILYRTDGEPGNDVIVTIRPNEREIRYQGQPYSVQQMPGEPESYTVTYPSDRKYTAIRMSGVFQVYDESGEMVPQSMVYVGDRRVLSPGEEAVLPSQLVVAAYEDYQRPSGNPFRFLVAVGLFVYGWCGFRYVAFQRLLYNMSFRWASRDSEPSEHYFVMTKLAAIAVMVCAAVWGVKSW